MSDKQRGTVKWFNKDKSFGFISAAGKDYLVHFSAIRGDGFKNLHEGNAVLFKVVKGSKGFQAEEVELA